MKNKTLLQKAGAWILSAAMVVSCLSGIPAATVNAADVDVSNWKKEIYIDFGTGTQIVDGKDNQLADTQKFAENYSAVCNEKLVAGYGTMLYDSATEDVGTLYGEEANGQKIGFDRVLPAGYTNSGGNYFVDWVFSPGGEAYTFSADLPVGQYSVYVYTGNKTGNCNNTTKVSFCDDNYTAIYEQTSPGGSQYTYENYACVYNVNVEEENGSGYGTLRVKLFDDTLSDGNYTNSHTVVFGTNANTTFNANGTTVQDDAIVTARLNGIEIMPIENAVKAERISASDETDISIEVGQTKTLAAEASPETATERVEYFSSNEKVVTVNAKTGEITSVAPGTATVTATTPSLIGDASKSVQYNVTVSEVSTLELDPAALSLELNAETGTAVGTIKATFNAKNLDEARTALDTTATSSAIATVAFGEVTQVTAPADGAQGVYSQNITITANAKGSETITIKRTTGREASFRLTVTKPVTSIAFYDAEEKATVDKYEMVAGTKLTVKAKALPEDASNINVKYESGNTDIAAISASGLITAKKSGTVSIKAVSRANEAIAAEATLTVTPGFDISYESHEITLAVEETGKNELTTTFKPDVIESQLTNKNISYSSSEEAVATVSEDGTVTAVSVGDAVITARAEDGGQEASYTVHVKSASIPAKKVTLNKTTATLNKGKTLTVKATMKPKNSTDTLTWTSSNKKVATVTAGKIKAVGKGTAKITVKTTSGKTAKITITVKVPATKLTVSGKGLKKKNATLKKGKKLTLTAKVTPNKSTDKVKWSVNKNKVVTIKTTKKGAVITAKKKGKAVITAKAGKKSVKITITVK